MLTTAAVIFAVAAVGGAILAIRHFQNKPLPLPLAFIHGLLAASGLAVLLIAIVSLDTPGSVTTAAILFGAAALGGFVLVSFHMRGKRHPSALILLHGGLAVTAFLILLSAIL
jgi:hypothetical protein